MAVNVLASRAQFPALKHDRVYLDNPGGTQIARSSLDRIQEYLLETNANHNGAFLTSRQSDACVDAARLAMAEFLNARGPEEIVFGPNMTSLTFNLSRSLVRTFKPGDAILVTRLDHDANISPWVMAAEDQGCRIRWVDFHPEDGTLDLEDLQAALAEKPRLLAVGYASNALGTINPLEKIIPMAHAAGALVYVDAVQYAPHGPIDVQRLDCDFLVCSAYKFFGPHLGALYGRYELLEGLRAYRVRPAPVHAPGKFETGTGAFEMMAGALGALEYIEWLGQAFGQEFKTGQYSGRRETYKMGMAAIQDCELGISKALIHTLTAIPGLRLYGLADPARVAERVPTFSFTLTGLSPAQVATELDRQKINVWDGHFYAVAVTERLKLDEKGGLIRVGATHYNTLEEIERLGYALSHFE